MHGCWICSGNRQNRFMQLTSKHFCDNFLKQSKTFYTTLPRSKPSSLSSISNIAFKAHYVFFAIAGQVKQSCVCNASNASNVSIPMLQMKVCFLWTPWKEFKVHLESNYSEISRVYFFGDTNFNFSVNTIILSAIIYCTYYELAARNIYLEGR